MRLNKYIALCSEYSRRGADELIENGKVTVNGAIAVAGAKVEETDKICIDGVLLKLPSRKVVIAFNKPVGVTVTKSDSHAEVIVDDLIDYPEHLTYAGRLDKDSEGLLLLSNDGDFINDLMKGSHAHEKEYIVKLNKSADEGAVNILRKGIFLKELNVKTRPCKILRISGNEFSMVLTQGLNRQIRRMWHELGYTVVSLKRIRIENITLGDLKTGTYRELDDKELSKLYSIISNNRGKEVQR